MVNLRLQTPLWIINLFFFSIFLQFNSHQCVPIDGCNKQLHWVACSNKYIPNHVFGALLGILWDRWSESKTLFCLGSLVWGTVFTLSVISAVRWMCSWDKCFPWWGPYLTTNHLSPETDDDLKLPPSLAPLYFGLTPGHCGCAVCMLATFSSSRCGGSSQPTTPESMSFSAFVNEKPVWVEVGLKSLRHNCKEYFPDIEGKLQHYSLTCKLPLLFLMFYLFFP